MPHAISRVSPTVYLFPPDSIRVIAAMLIVATSFGCTPRDKAEPGLGAASDSASGAGAHSSMNALVLPPPLETPSAVNFPRVIGWPAELAPGAPAGFSVTRFAANLRNPRWLYVLPNGDVLVAESQTDSLAGIPAEIADMVKASGLIGKSANRVTLLRDKNGDGRAEVKETFLSGLNKPFGMVLVDSTLYVASTDAVIAVPYRQGQNRISAQPRTVLDLPAGGYNNHWTRNIVASPSGKKLYVSVGSQTNVDEEGLDAREPRRAAILEINPDGSAMRIFASGLRNPNGMDWETRTNALWVSVNERDGLGDELVPDYITSVRDGAFYGWPYSYFGKNEDPRQKGKRPDLIAKAVVPDFAVGAHTASLGLVFYRGDAFPPRYRGGAFIGQHGSWNRSRFAGYRVAFVPFANGRPSGPIEDFLAGFIANEGEKTVYGRPAGLAVMRDGSLLVADDAGGIVWRVTTAQR